MNKNLNNLKNLLHINIKNKKSSFFLNKKILNKQVQSNLIQMKKNNLLSLKKNYNDIQINLKFFDFFNWSNIILRGSTLFKLQKPIKFAPA